jgi:hypothetical protein
MKTTGYFCSEFRHLWKTAIFGKTKNFMKNSELLFIATLLVFCSIQKATAQANGIRPKNVPFYSEFIDEVPELKVPVEVTCGFEQLSLTEDQRNKLRPFTPAGYEIIGKLSINPNYNLIICGELVGKSYTPQLFVTDKEGLGVSNQMLFENVCYPDSTYYFKYSISAISQNQIVVVEVKENRDSGVPVNQGTKTIFEITRKGEIKKKTP